MVRIAQVQWSIYISGKVAGTPCGCEAELTGNEHCCQFGYTYYVHYCNGQEWEPMTNYSC